MTNNQTIHASCVALDGAAVLITGASGTGKSSLSLMLMALGCDLVADDRVLLTRRGDAVAASCPTPIKGAIEARGVGLLRAEAIEHAQVELMVDLNETEHERLPKRRKVTLLGCPIALIHAIDGPHFAPSILQILKAGWSDL